MNWKIKKFIKDHKSNLILLLVIVVVLVGFAWIRLGGSKVWTGDVPFKTPIITY